MRSVPLAKARRKKKKTPPALSLMRGVGRRRDLTRIWSLPEALTGLRNSMDSGPAAFFFSGYAGRVQVSQPPDRRAHQVRG